MLIGRFCVSVFKLTNLIYKNKISANALMHIFMSMIHYTKIQYIFIKYRIYTIYAHLMRDAIY